MTRNERDMFSYSRKLFDTIRSSKDKPFWIAQDHEMSYADLHREIERFSGVFDTIGLLNGAIVLVVVDDDWLAASIFFAALLDGKVPVVIAPDAGSDRVAATIALSAIETSGM